MEDDTHIHNMCDGHTVPLPHQVLNDCKLRLQNDKTLFYIFLYNLLFNGKKNTFFILMFMNGFTKQDQEK